jgi:coenzyme F420-reducing hydrogenase delta subunit
MFNMSAAMAGTFVEKATEMVQRIEELGPNPLRVNHSVTKTKALEETQ